MGRLWGWERASGTLDLMGSTTLEARRLGRTCIGEAVVLVVAMATVVMAVGGWWQRRWWR